MDAMELRTISVFCGLDVGKGEHHATALDRDGHRLHDRPLPQDEQALRALFDKLNAHGPVVAVVDQPASIGALPVAIARSMGVMVAYLPGLAMRRIADLHPGNAKTDARDASSSPRLPGRCRTPYAGSGSMTRYWPIWRSSSGSMTIWPVRSLGSATVFGGCSPKFILPWSG